MASDGRASATTHPALPPAEDKFVTAAGVIDFFAPQMLRLSRSRGSSQAAQYEDAKRLEHAVEARAAAEEALSQARVSNKELQARIAELEGAPAAREHAASVRALEGANARLTAKLEAATHEQKVLGDVVAEKERDVEQLQHRLRSVEHGSTQHDTRASRLHAELEEARLALAEERKHRYLAEDRLRLAERKVAVLRALHEQHSSDPVQ